MSSEPPRSAGLFSSLTIGRGSRAPRQVSETITHPLLGGASTSSLSLPMDSGDAGPSHSLASSADIGALPYKPRQRHGGGPGSGGSAGSVFGVVSPTISPINTTIATVSPGLSPAPPSIGVSAPPTTSTSTSTTFALPPSASDAPSTQLDPFTLGGTPSSASATSRLQLQSLKAAAQKIGLGNGSMGMGMIDAIFDKGQVGRARADSGDWADLLRLLTCGKAIILLPSTPASSLPMTPQTLRDHIAFLSPPIAVSSKSSDARGNVEPTSIPSTPSSISVLVTLSGLIGTLRSNTIIFESTLPSDSPLISALKDDALRAGALSSLRPTQGHTISTQSFPAFGLSTESTPLSFPPLAKGPQPTISGLPEGTKLEKKDKEGPVKLGRINPFASFFGGSNTQTPASSSTGSPSRGQGTLTPERPSSPSPGPSQASSPRPSIISLDHADTVSTRSEFTPGDGYQVTAYTVLKPIRYADVHKSLVKAIRATVRQELEGLPDRVVDKALKFVSAFVCPMGSVNGVDQVLLKNLHHGLSATETEAGVVPLDFSDPTACGERLQDYMEAIYDDLIAHYRAIEFSPSTGGLKRKISGNAPWSKTSTSTDSQDNDEKEAIVRTKLDKEQYAEREASEGTERVEGLVCRFLYNRIFSPIQSDDDRHDEALASRIAALNMLDLSLDHLGLITHPDDEEVKGTIATGLASLIESIGTELQRLSALSCLTPKDKADVLVRAHKIVVDGLACLPPVELRPEGEPYRAPPTEEFNETDPNNLLLVPQSTTEASSSQSTGCDTLETIAESSEKTPTIHTASSSTVPDLELGGDSDPQSNKIEEAMADSVLTLVPDHANLENSPIDTRPPAISTTVSNTAQATTRKLSSSGADLILPIIIFAVVKSNPPQLASQLMYLRRYRSAICLTGEASYAIVNLTAVVEFIEHVELADLGLGEASGKVMSVEDLSPIGLNYLDDANADTASIASASSRLRGRVFQVSELAGSAAGSANKVITGVVDSSWSALRGFISPNAPTASLEDEGSVPLPNSRPGMRPRQASTFSLASVTASVANIAAAASTAAARTRSRASSRASEQVWGGNQEMIEVASRPESIREHDSAAYSDPESDSHLSEEAESDEEIEVSNGRARSKSDARSIISVSSMLSREGRRDEMREPKIERATISNRLASIGVLGRLSTPPVSDMPVVAAPSDVKTGFLVNLTSRSAPSVHTRSPSSHGNGSDTNKFKPESITSPTGSLVSLPPIQATETFEPPMERFLTCEVEDIRLAEVSTLLRDYRRLAGIINKFQVA